MQIDIREQDFVQVTEIVFGDGFDKKDAYKLVIDGSFSKITSQSGESVYLNSEDDALNLIKAIQKAIELGSWG